METICALSARFADVVACTRCTLATDPKLLRDDLENVPQPGWVGPNFHQVRLLLVGQNPAVPGALEASDRPYTQALRHLRDHPDEQRYGELVQVLRPFIPRWPVHSHYFPLEACGLTLEDIAYCNVVRCRTLGNSKPGVRLSANCIDAHFTTWLRELRPRAVVFVGKAPADWAGPATAALGIPFKFMNRLRSLSTAERAENREEVVRFVKQHCRPG